MFCYFVLFSNKILHFLLFSDRVLSLFKQVISVMSIFSIDFIIKHLTKAIFFIANNLGMKLEMNWHKTGTNHRRSLW